jgi:hypothetical protein
MTRDHHRTSGGRRPCRAGFPSTQTCAAGPARCPTDPSSTPCGSIGLADPSAQLGLSVTTSSGVTALWAEPRRVCSHDLARGVSDLTVIPSLQRGEGPDHRVGIFTTPPTRYRFLFDDATPHAAAGNEMRTGVIDGLPLRESLQRRYAPGGPASHSLPPSPPPLFDRCTPRLHWC